MGHFGAEGAARAREKKEIDHPTAPILLVAHQFLSMTNRISLATTFTGNLKHLKRNIKKILKSKGIGHIMQTTIVNSMEKQTSLFMEGESNDLYHVQKELVSHLQSIFPGISIQDWQEMASETPLFDSTFAPPGDSSGFIKELGDAINHQTDYSKWREFFDSGFIQVVTAIQNGRQVAYEIQSSIDDIREKFIYINYKTTMVHLNIGACYLWAQLVGVIQKCEILNIKKPIKRIYSIVNGIEMDEIDLLGFKADSLYYVETEDEISASLSEKSGREFKSMGEFYEALAQRKGWIEKYTEIVKVIFESQCILLEQLSTLTDAELKEYGLVQGGLREAVLAVIHDPKQVAL